MAKRLVVLISGAGSNLRALLAASDLGGEVVRTVADRPEAEGLALAEAAGVEAVSVDFSGFEDRAEWERALAEVVEEAEPDVVVLAGFMRILSAAFVRRWTIVNVHPSLLPAFRGPRAVHDALQWGVKVTGVTVHLVDEHVDHGPILVQECVPVDEEDSVDTLHTRLRDVEHRLLPNCVALLCQDRVAVDGRLVRIRP